MQFNTSRFNPIGLGRQEETINKHFVLPYSNQIGLSNTSRFNPIGLGLQEDTINGDFVLPHSNQIGLVRSQLLANNPAIDLHQNGFIFERSPPIVGRGQLGLSQRVTEVRRAYVTPHRVQVHTLIDYYPMQNHLAFPPSEVSVTEIVRTRFLTTTSSREDILVPNSTIYIQGQPNFQNQNVNDLFTENVPFHSPFYQNLTQNCQTLNLMGLTDHRDPKRDEILSHEPISAYVPKANLNLSGNRILNNDHLGINFQNICKNESSRNQMRVSNLVNPLRVPSSERVPSSPRVPNIVIQNDLNDSYDVEDDGMTHSLPTKKYGPYTCPKCMHVFFTSQSFAAHISSHYKHESKTERKKRQAAKYKKKYRHPFQSHNELTVKPASFKMVGVRNICDKRNMATKIEENEVFKQKEVMLGVATKRDLPYVGVKIKEEPM